VVKWSDVYCPLPSSASLHPTNGWYLTSTLWNRLSSHVIWQHMWKLVYIKWGSADGPITAVVYTVRVQRQYINYLFCLHFLVLLHNVFHNRRLCQSGDISQVVFFVGSHLAQNAAHDLSRAGLGKTGCYLQVKWSEGSKPDSTGAITVSQSTPIMGTSSHQTPTCTKCTIFTTESAQYSTYHN